MERPGTDQRVQGMRIDVHSPVGVVWDRAGIQRSHERRRWQGRLRFLRGREPSSHRESHGSPMERTGRRAGSATGHIYGRKMPR
jgi:hypothetical protein